MNSISKKPMNRDELMAVIKMLAKSQGYYGRLLQGINGLSKSAYEYLMREWESKKFEDSVDFILYIECGE